MLTLGGIFQTASYATYWVFLARGLMRAQLLFSLASRIVLIGCIFVGSRWGAMGVAIGYSFGLLVTWPLSLVWVGKISDAPVGALFTNAVRAMTAYGVAGDARITPPSPSVARYGSNWPSVRPRWRRSACWRWRSGRHSVATWLPSSISASC